MKIEVEGTKLTVSWDYRRFWDDICDPKGEQVTWVVDFEAP